MKLHPTRDAGLAALGVLLGGLTYVNTSLPAEATIWCTDLAKCQGNAGCNQGGSLSGCTLTCTGGGQAVCQTKSGG